jgi:mRNA interferase HicA
MQRRALIRHLTRHSCILRREGGNHSIYINPATNARSAVPRHREIADLLAKSICQQLGIPEPSK